MNKKIIIAASIFLTIAVVGAGIYFSSKQNANNADNTTGQSASQQKETSENALLPVKKLNCDDVADVKAEADCQAEVMKLLNSADSSVCEDLTSEADKSTCRHSYIIKQAADSGDLNKCKQAASENLISDCTAQASFSLAIQKKDKKYCENIINQTDKENCLKVLDGMGVK